MAAGSREAHRAPPDFRRSPALPSRRPAQAPFRGWFRGAHPLPPSAPEAPLQGEECPRIGQVEGRASALGASPSLFPARAPHVCGPQSSQPRRSCGERGPLVARRGVGGAARGSGPREAPRTPSLRAGRPGRWPLQGRPRRSAARVGALQGAWACRHRCPQTRGSQSCCCFLGDLPDQGRVLQTRQSQCSHLAHCLTPPRAPPQELAGGLPGGGEEPCGCSAAWGPDGGARERAWAPGFRCATAPSAGPESGRFSDPAPPSPLPFWAPWGSFDSGSELVAQGWDPGTTSPASCGLGRILSKGRTHRRQQRPGRCGRRWGMAALGGERPIRGGAALPNLWGQGFVVCLGDIMAPKRPPLSLPHHSHLGG